MLGLILIIVAIILAFVSAFVPTRPSWLLELAVILGFIGVLLGPTTLHISS